MQTWTKMFTNFKRLLLTYKRMPTSWFYTTANFFLDIFLISNYIKMLTWLMQKCWLNCSRLCYENTLWQESDFPRPHCALEGHLSISLMNVCLVDESGPRDRSCSFVSYFLRCSSCDANCTVSKIRRRQNNNHSISDRYYWSLIEWFNYSCAALWQNGVSYSNNVWLSMTFEIHGPVQTKTYTDP